MSKTFVTSDTFFGRKNAIKLFKRKFSSVEEMNNEMIERWNSKVNKEDTVYHLGNFAWDPFSVNHALQSLNGKIKFLLGNKDKALNESANLYENVIILPLQIIELNIFKVVLCHYPLEYWNGKENGILHLHGHNYKEFPTDLNKHIRVNVCSDYWKLAPVEINTIKELVEEYKKTQD